MMRALMAAVLLVLTAHSFAQDAGWETVVEESALRVGIAPTALRIDEAGAELLLADGLTRQEAVALALARNAVLRAAFAELGVAEAELRLAGHQLSATEALVREEVLVALAALQLAVRREALIREQVLPARERAHQFAQRHAMQMEYLAVELYQFAAQHAENNGLLLADTKFEFGLIDDELLLIDELLTPDSSRYWDAAQWAPGHQPVGFDKQYLRDWLETPDGWDKTPPGPELPGHVVAKTRELYVELMRRLTGRTP